MTPLFPRAILLSSVLLYYTCLIFVGVFVPLHTSWLFSFLNNIFPYVSNILNFSLLGDLWGFGMFLFSNLLLWPLPLHSILLLFISFLLFNLLCLLLTCPTCFLLHLPHFLFPHSVQIVSKFWYILQNYCHFQYYDHCQYTGRLKLIFSCISISCMVWCYY